MEYFASQDRCCYSLYFDLNIWFRARKVTGTFEKRTPESLMIEIRAQSSIWNWLESRILDCFGFNLTFGDWFETGRFDASHFYTNSSSEFAQKFRSLQVKFAVEQENHFGWIFFVEICLKRSTRYKIKWRRTAASARLLHLLNLSNVDDFSWSWILNDLNKEKRKFVLLCSGPP